MNTIYLNAKVESDLDWRSAIKSAEALDNIIWHLDLGFFHELRKPIDDEGQYRSLRLALDHFVQKIWTPLASKTQSVMIYQGNLTADMPIEHLVELVELLPDEIPLMAKVTTHGTHSIVDKAFLLSSNRFGRIHLEHDAPFQKNAKRGVLVPQDKAVLSQSIEPFLTKNSNIRLLSEQHLTLEWDELDELYVFHRLDANLRRKILGFEAAGGVVIADVA